MSQQGDQTTVKEQAGQTATSVAESVLDDDDDDDDIVIDDDVLKLPLKRKNPETKSSKKALKVTKENMCSLLLSGRGEHSQHTGR